MLLLLVFPLKGKTIQVYLDKNSMIQDTEADIVATDCPGCEIQLIDNSIRRKMPVKVMHIMELLE